MRYGTSPFRHDMYPTCPLLDPNITGDAPDILLKVADHRFQIKIILLHSNLQLFSLTSRGCVEQKS